MGQESGWLPAPVPARRPCPSATCSQTTLTLGQNSSQKNRSVRPKSRKHKDRIFSCLAEIYGSGVMVLDRHPDFLPKLFVPGGAFSGERNNPRLGKFLVESLQTVAQLIS